MKISSPNSPIPKGPPSILLRGAPGSHKTTLSMQFPGVGILDCDENLEGPDLYLREGLKVPVEYRYTRIRYDDQDKPITAPELWWTRYVVSFNQMIADPLVKTIATDSLTGLDEILLRAVMKQQARVDDMRIQDWIPFRLKLRETMFRMRQTGKTNLVICHEEQKFDRKTGELLGYDVFLSSKLSEIFGWIFTDVWYIEARPDLGGKHRSSTIFFSPTGLRKDLKNSRLMPERIETDNPKDLWTKINDFLKLT